MSTREDRKVKLFAPGYYKDFACIADRCSHSCCIGWEIDIDDEAMEKYSRLSEGYGLKIRKSIEGEDPPHFALAEGERCPHLDERGLCKIITELGEDHLCAICREHPRFYNDTARGMEVGIGLACSEAARLVLSSDRYGDMEPVGESEGESFFYGFDAASVREELYCILCDRSVPYGERLLEISRRYNVSLKVCTDLEWREQLASLEYLDPSHRELFCAYTSELETCKENEEALERALAYFIYRHVSPCTDEAEVRGAIGFALLCERLLCSLAEKKGLSLEWAAVTVSEELEYSEDNTDAIKFRFMAESL